MEPIETLLVRFNLTQQMLQGVPAEKLQLRRVKELKELALNDQAALSLAFAQLVLASAACGNPVVMQYVEQLTPFFSAQPWYNPTVAMDIELPLPEEACLRVAECLEQAIASYTKLYARLAT
ncbi:MAG TPA: hypothetical protein VFZ48_02980 [Candidatus Saccharimonadales bacterium]